MSKQIWSTNREKPSELACSIARDIFSSGDNGDDKAQRLAFKGGKYPDHETDLGGYCEEALA